MKLELPKLIENFVKASNEKNAQAYALCFTNTAAVVDDGETIKGREAISEWFTETMEKYNFTTEPTALKESADQIVLTVKASGTFPGSPLSFDYFMNLKSGLINNLRIELAK